MTKRLWHLGMVSLAAKIIVNFGDDSQAVTLGDSREQLVSAKQLSSIGNHHAGDESANCN